MTAPDPVRVLVVDDHPVVRDGLRGQLVTQDDIVVVGEAASSEEALAVLASRPVDVVLTDLRMPGMGGTDLIKAVRDRHPGIEVIVLTTYDTDDDVRPAVAAGARGYLLKDAGREAVFAAVRAARRGVATYAAGVRDRLATTPASALLSSRELEVLRLVAAGRTNRQIGAALYIGEATVKTHLQHIFTKLHAADRAAAVAAGYRHGLL
jgi:DNA-binding NarL/FixJ family response regulator